MMKDDLEDASAVKSSKHKQEKKREEKKERLSAVIRSRAVGRRRMLDEVTEGDGGEAAEEGNGNNKRLVSVDMSDEVAFMEALERADKNRTDMEARKLHLEQFRFQKIFKQRDRSLEERHGDLAAAVELELKKMRLMIEVMSAGSVMKNGRSKCVGSAPPTQVLRFGRDSAPPLRTWAFSGPPHIGAHLFTSYIVSTLLAWVVCS